MDKTPMQNFLMNEMIHEMNHTLNCYDPRSYERNFSNCVEKPEKLSTSTEFEPVTSRVRRSNQLFSL